MRYRISIVALLAMTAWSGAVWAVYFEAPRTVNLFEEFGQRESTARLFLENVPWILPVFSATVGLLCACRRTRWTWFAAILVTPTVTVLAVLSVKIYSLFVTIERLG